MAGDFYLTAKLEELIMKKSDLRDLIKPLVKECIQEVLIEEGYLSNIVSEVAKGMQANLVVESKPPRSEPVRTDNRKQIKNSKLADHRKKMMEAIGADAYNGVNLFEGTEPMTSADSGNSGGSGAVDLGNPSDAGVDISSLIGGASKIWKGMK